MITDSSKFQNLQLRIVNTWEGKFYFWRKVDVFLEGHKKLWNLHCQFDIYLVSAKSTVKIF